MSYIDAFKKGFRKLDTCGEEFFFGILGDSFRALVICLCILAGVFLMVVLLVGLAQSIFY